MGKVASLKTVARVVAGKRKRGKKVGLITGCFDILHMGHVDLFQYAKKHVDFLVVGVERDETLKSSKGDSRPVNKLEWRCQVLAETLSVDLVFPVEFVVRFHPSEEIGKLYRKMYEQIRPDYLITNVVADRFWTEKKNAAGEMGIGFLGQRKAKPVSSTSILTGSRSRI